MAFIGNTVQTQGFTPAIDYFNGNGVTVTFTLSRPVASVAQMIVAIDNVIQNPSSAFNVSGSSITFTSAPLSGTNNIWVEYTSLITTYAGISQDPSVIGDITATGGFLSTGDFGNSFVDGTVVDYVTGRGRITVGELDDVTFYHGGTAGRSAMMDLYYAGGAKIYGTTALTLPSGTTAERPGTPVNGMIRFNTTLSQTEVYQNSVWIAFAAPAVSSVSYLIVAGGAGGASGGGGAGGLLSGTAAVATGTTYTLTVGSGGTGGSGGGATSATNGQQTTAFSLTAVGGGYGALIGNNQPGGGNGGGSGGGGGGFSGGTTAGGSGTSGQGNAGGSNGGQTGDPYPAGGGGGASAVGQNASGGNVGGNGGAGTASSISGASVTYAGGGGGGVYSNTGTPGTGGAGGGGAGAGAAAGGNGTAGTANRGGGGGGSGVSGTGGAGGSGVVIVAYSTAYKAATATGTYTQTVSGGNYIYTFTGSGTITF
jgi:hypothetical protein